MIELWQSGPELYRNALISVAAVGAFTFALLFFVSAPYGRHHRAGWGPSMPARLAWIAMEAPSFLSFALGAWLFALSGWSAWLLAALFAAHYAYRSFVFPFRIKGGGKPKPWLTVLIAVAFNLVNGSVNAFDLSRAATPDPLWLGLGLALFVGGAAINHHADWVLLNLRKPGETDYKIPHGGLYAYVSAPNYLGEMIQWIGFALAACTPAAAVFAWFTFCNLVPRAHSHHQWYRERFEDYPEQRKRLIPFIW